MLATQDQVVAARVYKKKIMKRIIPSILRQVCEQAEETILHLLSACPVQTSITYVHRHNLVACVIHWHLHKHFLLSSASKPWFSHNPPPVCENLTTKSL